MFLVCEAAAATGAEPGFQPQKVLRTFWGARKDARREPRGAGAVQSAEGGGPWGNHGFPHDWAKEA
jgi:hypothetical protein